MWCVLTWITEGNKASALEVTVPIVPPMHLIISIHGIWCMCKKLVRLETIPTLINLPAVHPTRSTAEIQHSLKHLLIGMRLGHAPHRRTPKSTGHFLTEPYCPSIAAKLAAQIYIIYLRPIPIENPKISLARTPFLFVFIEQSKHKYLNLIFWLHGCPFIRLCTFNQPSVVSPCIL